MRHPSRALSIKHPKWRNHSSRFGRISKPMVQYCEMPIWINNAALLRCLTSEFPYREKWRGCLVQELQVLLGICSFQIPLPNKLLLDVSTRLSKWALNLKQTSPSTPTTRALVCISRSSYCSKDSADNPRSRAQGTHHTRRTWSPRQGGNHWSQHAPIPRIPAD